MLIILAMDYRQWLLATTCLYTPNIVRECAAPRALVRKLNAQQTNTSTNAQ